MATTTKTKKPADKTAPKKTTPEVIYLCEVIASNKDGSPLKIGAMNCGIGAQTQQPEAKAKAMEKEGWVKILGIV